MSASPRVLAVASAGGHWVQLMRLRRAFTGCDVVYVSTRSQDLPAQAGRFYRVPDANKNTKLALLSLTVAMLVLFLREQPEVVISTGAAPGYIAIRIGRLFGSRTIWIDSMANVDRLSLSGRMSLTHADLCLTQWRHLARPDGPFYEGAVV